MEKLKTFLKNNRNPNIVVLTGAGISAESGIKTFRDSGGLWENYRIEDVATPAGFFANPDLVYAFYNERRRQAKSCKPNRAHEALVELEAMFPDNFLLITQNIDDLHEKAGSKNILHMHGEIFKTRCIECHSVFEWYDDLFGDQKCIHCKSSLRPHIVWFNEMPLYLEEIMFALEQCDLFISAGTSGTVHPAAGFGQMASGKGAHTVEINLNRTGNGFDTIMEGQASKGVSDLLSLIKTTYLN